MRVPAPVLIACLVLGLSGCAEIPTYEEPTLDEEPSASETDAPERVVEEEVRHDAPQYPPVTSVVTEPFTAPVDVVLATASGKGLNVSLVAGSQGLRCDSVPTRSLGTPSGYKSGDVQVSCTLLAEGLQFAHGARDSLDASIPLMADIPVDTFTWDMKASRTLINNSGEHEDILASATWNMSAGPGIWSYVHSDEDRQWWSGHYSYCDTLLTGHPTRLVIESYVERGLAEISIDTTDMEIYEVHAPGHEVDGENASDVAGPVWWMDEHHLHYRGDWSDDLVRIEILTHFRGNGGSLALVPPPDCPDALFVQDYDLDIESVVHGIAAGWVQHSSTGVGFQVYRTW